MILAMFDEQGVLQAFAREIRRRRTALKLTLDEFAERAGLTPNYIGAIELGKRDPSLTSVAKLAHGLDVGIGELFGTQSALSAAGAHAGRLFETLPEPIQAAFITLIQAYLRTRKRNG